MKQWKWQLYFTHVKTEKGKRRSDSFKVMAMFFHLQKSNTNWSLFYENIGSDRNMKRCRKISIKFGLKLNEYFLVIVTFQKSDWKLLVGYTLSGNYFHFIKIKNGAVFRILIEYQANQINYLVWNARSQETDSFY